MLANMKLSELKPEAAEQTLDRYSLGQAALIAGSVALFVNTLLLLLVRWLLDVDSGFEGLRFWGVFALTVTAIVLGAAVLWISDLMSSKPFTVFVVAAAIAAIASASLPITVGRSIVGATDTTVIVQLLMHFTTAVIAIPVFYRYPRQDWPVDL